MIFYEVNLINILFLQLTFVIVVLGSLMSVIESKLPDSIRQMFRFGKCAHKGNSDRLIEIIEIPKSWFSHFYVFAIFWSWFWSILAISIYFYGYQPNKLLLNYLDLSCGRDRGAESKLFLSIFHLSKVFHKILHLFSSISIRNSCGLDIDDYSMHPKIYRE